MYLLLIFILAKYILAQSKGDDNTKDMSEVLNLVEEVDFKQPHLVQCQGRAIWVEVLALSLISGVSYEQLNLHLP